MQKNKQQTPEMTWRGYSGAAVWSTHYQEYCGRVLNCKHDVFYHGKTAEDVLVDFKCKVDEYIKRHPDEKERNYAGEMEWYLHHAEISHLDPGWTVFNHVFRLPNLMLWNRSQADKEKIMAMAQDEATFLFEQMAIEGVRYESEEDIEALVAREKEKYQPVFDKMYAETADWKAEYRRQLIEALKGMKATPAELALVTDAVVNNNFRQKRDPRSVAWALLQ